MSSGIGAVAGGISGSTATAVLSLTSAAIWGTSDFVGGIAARRLPSSAVVMLSHGLSLMLLVSLALATSATFPDRASTIYGMLAGAACGVGVMVLYKALALGSMGLTAAISGVLAAVLPVLWAFATEGLPKPRQILGFVLAAVAIWMIAATPSNANTDADASTRQGILLGAVAGISFGLLLILLKLAGRGGVLWPLAWSRLISASLAAAVTLWGARSASPRPPASSAKVRMLGWPGWSFVGLIVITGVFDASGNSLYTMATRLGRLDIAAVLGSMYPVSTILLAAGLLKERTTRNQAAGMLLALVAVVMISA